MQILEHTAVQQIGEENDHAGKIFCVDIRLEGQFTLTELRQHLHDELMPLILADISRSDYRMLSITPDCIKDSERCRDLMHVDSVRRGIAHRQDRFYLDTRAEPRYRPGVPHRHPDRFCTSSIGIEEGTLPTMFVRDESEFSAIIRDSLDEMESLFGDRRGQWECGADAIAVADILEQGWETVRYDLQPRFRKFIRTIKETLTGKIVRMPELGRINIFETGVIHASDDSAQRKAGNAGTLFVEMWQKT